MDHDAYVAIHGPEWERLRVLSKNTQPSGAEADEMVRLYQRANTHLSTIRSSAPDPATVSSLSQLLLRARGTITGGREFSWTDFGRYFAVQVPAALYRVRWWSVGVTLVCVGLAVVVGWWVATHPETHAAMGSAADIQQYIDNDFEEYYEVSLGFASVVWTNNAWLAVQCVAFGITGVYPALLLVNNAINIGMTGGLMVAHDAGATFFAFILPHGMLELTAFFVAGGAGLALFWAWIVPGRDRTRSRALAQEGRTLMTVAIGLTVVLGISGLIEGFITGSGLPAWLKLAIGAVAFVGFWVVTFVVGGKATRAGITGDMRSDYREVEVAVRG